MAGQTDSQTLEHDEPQVLVEDVAAQPIAPSDEGGDEGENVNPPAPPKFYEDEKRGDIYERIEAKKAEVNKEFTGDPNDPALIYGRQATDPGEGEGDPEIEELERQTREQAILAATQELSEFGDQQEAGAPEAQQGQQPMVKVKVDGVERDVPLADLVNSYQMNSAAEDRLLKAKAIYEQAKQLQASRPAHEPGTPTGHDDDAYHSDDQGQDDAGMPQPDEADIEALYERAAETLQLGDSREAGQALRELMSSVATQADPQEIAATAAFQIRMDEENRRSDMALRQTLQENEFLATDHRLQGIGLNFMDEEMVADFQAAGATPESIAAQIQGDPGNIRKLHQAGRAMGVQGFRPLADILPVAVDKTKGWLSQTMGAVQPAYQPQSQQVSDRMARVQRVAPQPAQRAGPPARPAPPRETVQDAIAEMRRMRGRRP